MCVTSGTATWPVRGCVRPGSGTTPSAPRLVTARPGSSSWNECSADGLPTFPAGCAGNIEGKGIPAVGSPREHGERPGRGRGGRDTRALSSEGGARSARGRNAPTSGQPTARLSQTQVTLSAPRPPAPHHLSRAQAPSGGTAKVGGQEGREEGRPWAPRRRCWGPELSIRHERVKTVAERLPRSRETRHVGHGAAPRCSERSLLGGRSAPSQKSPVQLSLATHLGLVHK